MTRLPTDLVLLVFVLGTAASLATSWLAVQRLERIGELLGFSEALLGLLAALVADSPEITAAVTAAVHHQRVVGAGVAIGSNVFNLAALLGIGTLAAGRLNLHRKVVLLSGAVAMWIALVCLLAVSGEAAPGTALAAVCVVLVPYALVLAAGPARLRRIDARPANGATSLRRRALAWLAAAVEDEERELLPALRPRRGTARDAAVAFGALVVVVAASAAMESAAASLGSRFSVPSIVVGGIILAAVTSLPNAVAAAYLAARGRGAAVLSTTLNSNAFNVLAGFLLPATFIGSVRTSGAGLLVAGWFAGLTALALALASVQRGLRRGAGLALVTCYAIFVLTVVVIA